MTLTAGTRVGSYQIIAPLGAGGMGEVYCARDTRLGREVALKIIAPAFRHDADRLHRFEQESQAAGSISHPNILIVHDSGVHEGVPYLVSELLEGGTLRVQLEEGPLPVRKAIDYAMQVAQGLAAAHDKGIVHRDLKPQNIFVTVDGRVKILDFGVAKLLQPDPADHDPEATTRTRLTDPGAVVGTVGYMSPEQVRGQDVDCRADIFAFGVIFFEMLTGRRAFQCGSAAETMNAILKNDPTDAAELADRIPSQIAHVVRRCLEKLPARRFQSARDLSFTLEVFSTPSGPPPATIAPEARKPRFSRRECAFLGIAVFFGLALLLWRLSAPSGVSPGANTPTAVQFVIPAPANATDIWDPNLSPDGRSLGFIAVIGGGSSIWVRHMDSLVSQPVAGSEDVSHFFWSPDSRRIGFLAGGKLKETGLGGGTAKILCDAWTPGGAWSPDGIILFTSEGDKELHQIPQAGGLAQRVTTLDSSRGEGDHCWPQFLPDGRHFLYFATSARNEVYAGSLDSPDRKLLIEDADSNAIYTPDPSEPRAGHGYLLFVRDGMLMAQPFDPRKMQLEHQPLLVSEQIRPSPTSHQWRFSASDTGVLAFEGRDVLERMARFDREGRQLGTVGAPGDYSFLALSPDDKRLIVGAQAAGNSNLWLLDLARGLPSRLTFGFGNQDYSPVWSPDGGSVIFGSNSDGINRLLLKSLTGDGKETPLLESGFVMRPTDWSADGRFLLYEQDDPKTNIDLWVLPLFGDRKPFPFLKTDFAENFARFSPDARWIAYTSAETGDPEIYVQSFLHSGGKTRISDAGGIQPKWRRDGRELFYVTPGGGLMAVEVKSGSAFEPGMPRLLFQKNMNMQSQFSCFEAAADGQSFLLLERAEGASAPSITIIINWTSVLRRSGGARSR